MKSFWCGLGVACAAMAASTASAATVVINVAGSYSAGAGQPVYAASSTFTLNDVANTVSIRINNTMDSAWNNAAARDLCAFFWQFANATNGSSLTMNYTSVTSSDGGRLMGSNEPNGHNYNATQMFAYRNNLGGSNTWSGNTAATHGLSAAGLGLFNGASMLASGGPHPQPDGPDGTIVSPTGNAFSLGNPREQFRSYVEFVFSVPASFFAPGIDNIRVANAGWQFDTSQSGPRVPGTITLIPLPTGAGLAMAGLGLMGFRRRR